MTPAMTAALAANPTTLFGAVQIDLPSATVRVLDGSSELTFNGGTFKGLDPLYGALDAVDSIDDGFGDEAPSLQLTFLPASAAAVGDLANPLSQGSRVRLWLGALASGSVVADPELLFDGDLDQVGLSVGTGKRELEIECVSAFDKFFDQQEGVRLSPTFHKSLFPGETGLDNVTGVTNTIYWGVAQPAPKIVYDGSSTLIRKFLYLAND